MLEYMSSPFTDYKPIPCAFHERLEFAVLRRQKLKLQLLQVAGRNAEEIALPTDVFTRDGAEWIDLVWSDGSTGRVRLDAILRAEPV